ncbi:MAG: nucleotidyltransferase domain-containing protein [Candidatus Aenigmarchaeota archaeon]|nr:nucleotidyltransferase domain-containing protein [Candidatus Aenigmarchaeota archaeon]
MVYMYKLKLTILQQEIMRFLFMNAGESFNARGLAIPLGVSQPAIAKALPLLERRGFIHMAKDRNSKRLSIELRRENPLVIGMKRADNIRQLYESGFAEFIREKFPSCTIIVFGSFAKGEDTRNSDIDIAVIGAKSKPLDLSEFRKKLMKDIRINFYKSFKEIGVELRNNILGGILLSGWIEL